MARLVVVFLRGGADGLSLLAPAADPVYRATRPTQALTEDAVLDVGSDTFGLHPRAPRLAELVRAGAAAVVPAVGFDGQSRSHFSAQAAAERAGDRASPATGWLGRHLAATAGPSPRPFRGVAVGSVTVPAGLQGTGDALAVPDPSALRLGALVPARDSAGTAGYRVVALPDQPGAGTLARGWEGADGPPVAAAGAAAAVTVLEAVERSPLAVADPAAGGDGVDAGSFAAASALLDRGGTEIVQVDLGGWDTHNAQGTTDGVLADLVGGLDAGVGALVDRHAGRGPGLVVLVLSEFGRRVAENASGGFDHGRGGVVVVAGDGVAGGVRGAWPGLGDLDDGDVPAANDLWSVLAEVATGALGLSARERRDVVPGALPGDPLGLFG